MQAAAKPAAAALLVLLLILQGMLTLNRAEQSGF
jgi:hypothetical protein